MKRLQEATFRLRNPTAAPLSELLSKPMKDLAGSDKTLFARFA